MALASKASIFSRRALRRPPISSLSASAALPLLLLLLDLLLSLRISVRWTRCSSTTRARASKSSPRRAPSVFRAVWVCSRPWVNNLVSVSAHSSSCTSRASSPSLSFLILFYTRKKRKKKHMLAISIKFLLFFPARPGRNISDN